MNNLYKYCKICAIKVPQVHCDIHVKDCHYKKKTFCKKHHPYVKNGEMVSQIQVILDNHSEKKNLTMLGKWLTIDEPEFMKSFQFEFIDKFAFFSEYDLYHSHIKEHGAVLLQAGSVEKIFIAVSEKSELQPIGTVRLYEKVLKEYFPIKSDCLFVTVKRINRIEQAKKVCLKVGNEVDKTLLLNDIKSKFCTMSGIGWPYLFKKSGVLKMTNLMDEEFDAFYDVDDDESISKISSSDSFQSNYYLKSDLFNITMESIKCLSLESDYMKNSEESEEMALDIENKSEHKRKSFVRSSTPSREPKICKLGKTIEHPNGNSTSLPSLHISDIGPVNKVVYYWLSHDTTIEVVSPNKERQSRLFVRNNKKELLDYKPNPCFYKRKQYYLLKEIFMKKFNETDKTPSSSWSAILLIGLSNTGKTTLVQELCSELKLPLKVANILDYSRSSDTSKYISNCFQHAIQRAPSVLFLDELDSFGRKQSELSPQILKNLKLLKMSQKPVLIIGATDLSHLISSHMRQSGRFDKEVVLTFPDKNERTDIILHMINNFKNNIKEEEIKFLRNICIGFSPADIHLAFKTATFNAKHRFEEANGSSRPNMEDVCFEMEDLESAMKSVIPSVLRDQNYIVQKVQWESIFGYEDKKSKLKQIATDILEGRGSKGILFYGPPGCSKTMFAKALALETQFTFFTIKCSDLLSKYVGETEKNLNKAMEKAFLSSPALVFMDEIDSLCGRRDGSGGSESCIVPELLSVMRKAQNFGNILFIGATNRPHALDENLLGAGYFDLHLHFDLPDCASRCALWKGILEDVENKESICVSTLCQKTEDFSCVEIESIYQKAALYIEEQNDVKNFILTEELILKIISSTSTRTSKRLLNHINIFSSSRGRV